MDRCPACRHPLAARPGDDRVCSECGADASPSAVEWAEFRRAMGMLAAWAILIVPATLLFVAATTILPAWLLLR